MKLTKKVISRKIWVAVVAGWGGFLFYRILFTETTPAFSDILFYIFAVILVPLNDYLIKRKIEKGKKELGITGDLSLEALESLRIEKDYQDRIKKRFKL